MKMIWQLFGVHISLFFLFLLLLLAWLFWPRKYWKVRQVLLLSNALLVLGSFLLGVYVYYPYKYEKNYLKTLVPQKIEQRPLKQLADSIDFYIGMAILPEALYYDNVAQEFNSVVATNHFKPTELLVNASKWEFDFNKAEELMSFAESNNLRMRGHTLIWGKFPGRTYPAYWGEALSAAPDKRKEMETLMEKYISTVMNQFKGRVSDWDVVNEPMNGKELFPCIFTEAMGEEYIDFAFKTAHEVDPECKLFLNEQFSSYEDEKAQAFLDLLERLVVRKVPIHGVGLQSHHINQVHDVAALQAFIRKIAALGLEVEITELDVRLKLFAKEKDPYQAQGDQFKAIVEACIGHPACKGVTFWGLTDAANWMDAIPPFSWKSPNAPNILDEEMRKKPAYIGVWEALHAAQ